MFEGSSTQQTILSIESIAVDTQQNKTKPQRKDAVLRNIPIEPRVFLHYIKQPLSLMALQNLTPCPNTPQRFRSLSASQPFSPSRDF